MLRDSSCKRADIPAEIPEKFRENRCWEPSMANCARRAKGERIAVATQTLHDVGYLVTTNIRVMPSSPKGRG